MEERKDLYKTQYKDITIRTTDGNTLRGKVNIGLKERVSDLFVKTDNPYIIMLNAEHKDGSEKVLIINKNHIVWAEPED